MGAPKNDQRHARGIGLTHVTYRHHYQKQPPSIRDSDAFATLRKQIQMPDLRPGRERAGQGKDQKRHSGGAGIGVLIVIALLLILLAMFA
jgi:hypothetical protein